MITIDITEKVGCAMDYLSHNIALNLKRIRRSKGMSLDMTAEQTGVSKSMLSQIEKGTANPSIGVLGRITSGLRIDFNDLIGPPPQDALLVRISETAPTKDVEGQYRVWTCFPYQDNHHGEIYRIEIAPGGTYLAGSHGERTREYLAVQEGVLHLALDGDDHIIQRDEIFRFESSREHKYYNLESTPCVFLCFFLEYERQDV